MHVRIAIAVAALLALWIQSPLAQTIHSPTVNVPINITAAGSIACAIGPNISSIPAPAAAAGFNTCALNADWTSSSNFTYGGYTYNWSNVATWFDCNITNGNLPLWWRAVAGVGAGHWPCGDASVVNDGVTNALQMSFSPAEISDKNHTIQSVLPFSGNGTTALPTGTPFPNQFYVEFKGRMVSPDSKAPSGAILMDWWSAPATPNSSYTEFDFIEMYASVGDSAGANQLGNGFYPEVHYANSSVSQGYNHNNYNVFGERITMDSSANTSVCFYINGTQVNAHPQNGWTQNGNCATGSWAVNSGPLTELLTLYLTVGPQNNSTSLSGPIIANTEYLRVFSCSGWQSGSPSGGGACVGSPISTNP